MAEKLTEEQQHVKMKEEVKKGMEQVRENDKRIYTITREEGLFSKARNFLYWLYTE